VFEFAAAGVPWHRIATGSIRIGKGKLPRIKRPPTEAASFYMNKAIATIAMGLSPSATMSALKR
jgi:hypothetical protein